MSLAKRDWITNSPLKGYPAEIRFYYALFFGGGVQRSARNSFT